MGHALKLCLLLWLLLTSSLSFAQSTVQLIDSNEIVRLSSHFDIYRETGRTLTLSDILRRKDQFSRLSNINPNYGFHDKGLWLHINFSNVTDTKEWVIDIGFSQIDKADFYLLMGDEVLAQSRQGKLREGQQYRFPTFETQLPFATSLDLYIRVEYKATSLIAPVDIKSKNQHILLTFFDNLLWGLFYGSLGILAIYNLIQYPHNKEVSIIAYASYVTAVIFWQLGWGGHMQMLLPIEFNFWVAQHITLLFIFLAFTAGLFSYFFLDARKNAPKSAILIEFTFIAFGILTLCTLLNLLPTTWLNGMVFAIGMFGISVYLIAGFESYTNDFYPSKYFIFATSILICGCFISLLNVLGIMPSNPFTMYCFQASMFLHACLSAVALTEKIRNELETGIQQATNDLRNNMEFIEEQNARLDIARKDALKASQVKSQFLANMSHEIRTPLNAILGFSKELNQLTLSGENQEQVRIINAAADNLLGIVNDVLDVSKIEAGKLQINNHPFSPNQLLEEMVSVMSKSAQQKQLEFVLDLSPLPDKLIGDVMRIRQILNNLLSNALKFTQTGHITLSACGELKEHALFELKLMVEDTGIGISAKDKQKLFNAFSQVDDALSRSYQGTGLGLMICRQLVNLMHGEIALNSVPGQGSCFQVSLRLNLLNASQNIYGLAQWQDKQVLLFDPYPFTRRTTSKLLTEIGCKVTSIESITMLEAQTERYDFAFITLPQCKLSLREQMFGKVSRLNTGKTIWLYSGPEPISQYPSFEQLGEKQIRLPITPAKLEGMLRNPKETKKSPIQQKLLDLPRARVLAVDDMEMNLRLLKTWLKPSPLELTLAYSGEDAVAMCEKQEFDLILMDVQMPNMDGMQASRLIRQTELNLGTPIIAVTAHAFKEEQEKLLSSGMDDYLPKPIDLKELVNLIKRWCVQEEHQPVTVPSVDWELALKRANHNFEGAREVLTEFANQLPDIVAQIEMSWRQQDIELTKQVVHKLHGACCYTGVPKLHVLCDEIESALKKEHLDNLAEKVAALVTEAELVKSEAEKLLSEINGSIQSDFGTV